MKKTFILLPFLFTMITFSQSKKLVKSGYITFMSKSLLEFKNLTIDDKNATYYNEVSQTEMVFSLESIQKIVDESGKTVYPTSTQTSTTIGIKKENTTPLLDTINKKKAVEKNKIVYLDYQSANVIFLNGEKLSREKTESILLTQSESVYNQYEKGKRTSNLGTVLISGGLGLFIGGGLSNLSKAKKADGEGGSSTILIIGLATAGIGIPIKIMGASNVKKSISEYNNTLYKKSVSFIDSFELKVITKLDSGIGLQLKF